MLRYAELKDDPNKGVLLMFLHELQNRGMIRSELGLSEDGKRTERIWYGYHSSGDTPTEGEK